MQHQQKPPLTPIDVLINYRPLRAAIHGIDRLQLRALRKRISLLQELCVANSGWREGV